MISLNTQLRKRAWLARSFTLSPACHAKAVRHERRRVAPELSTPPKRLRRLDQRRGNHHLLNPVGAPTSGRGIAQNRDRELAIRNRAQSPMPRGKRPAQDCPAHLPGGRDRQKFSNDPLRAREDAPLLGNENPRQIPAQAPAGSAS
jgi:hypothetical protein